MIDSKASISIRALSMGLLSVALSAEPAMAQSTTDPANRGAAGGDPARREASPAASATIAPADCTVERFGTSVPVAAIGLPVSGVDLEPPVWAEPDGAVPAHCAVTGAMRPVDTSATARPIRFAVALPATWNLRAIQMGGSGINGVIPRLTGSSVRPGGPPDLAAGYATYGSDSGHEARDSQWLLNDEAIRNLSFMQMKKTHDAAMVLIERAYGGRPAFNYYIGTSQGGREALTVAQRFPDDYDGVAANVPIVGLSTLMLAPTLTRVQERKLSHWVPAAKGRAIAAELLRQCDGLDALVDGVINNYVDCRRRFNVNDGGDEPDPWAAKRCPGNVDPNPEDRSEHACLTAEQVETVNFVFSSYRPGGPMANGRTHFGMFAPTTAVAGGPPLGGPPPGPGARDGPPPAAETRGGPAPGPAPAGPPPMTFVLPGALFVDRRFEGQEGAADDAPVFATLGTDGVTGMIMQDVDANPLAYGTGAEYSERRAQISEWIDATDPDLSAFHAQGGRMIVAVGTNDTIAASGEQLDYYQTLLDAMGRELVDEFTRLYVLPQTGHGLTGTSAAIDGAGNAIEVTPIPSGFDRRTMLTNWVEKGIAPARSETVTGPTGSRPLCSYPEYPSYVDGDPAAAGSYRCAAPSAGR